VNTYLEEDGARSGATETVTHLCVLYDPSSGRVVHAHTFVGSSGDRDLADGADARERMARETATRYHDIETLKAAHARGEFTVERGATLSVVDGEVRAERPRSLKELLRSRQRDD
jgi:hypothetical protein